MGHWCRASDLLLSTLSTAVVFSLSARRWWYEVVVIVVVIVASYSSLLPPCHRRLIRLVRCHLEIHQITLFSRSWIRREGGAMLGADQRGPTFTSRFLGRQKIQALDSGERCVQMRSTSEWVWFFLFFRVFFAPGLAQTLSEVVFAHERVCLHTCTHARVYLSSRFPQCTIGPGGRERASKSEWVTQQMKESK